MTSVGVPIAFGSTQYFTAKQNVGQVKSFVDDLVMKLGTVSMRVALVLRSAEVQPVFRDLCIQLLSGMRMTILTPLSFKSLPKWKAWLPHFSVGHQKGVLVAEWGNAFGVANNQTGVGCNVM